MAHLTQCAIFVMLLSLTGCNVEPEVTELKDDDTYRLRVMADSDESGMQYMEALLNIGTDLCSGPFAAIGAAELDPGFPPYFPFLVDPAVVVDIKCGPSGFYDDILESVNKWASESK